MNESLALKIYTHQGVTKEKLPGNPIIIHLGCGSSKLNGAIGVDVLKMPQVDVVHNLDVAPWPFEDNSADIIFAHSVFEHLDNVIAVLGEMQRILKKGGRIIMEVPYFRCIDSFTDPTHTHFFTHSTMDYFIEGNNSLANYRYTPFKFKKIGFWYGYPQSKNVFTHAAKRLMDLHHKSYDQYWSLLFPVKILVWELEVQK